jgi:hypothetical protein
VEGKNSRHIITGNGKEGGVYEGEVRLQGEKPRDPAEKEPQDHDVR